MGECFMFGRGLLKTATPLSELPVGSSVYMNVNGVATEFFVVHQGNPDSSIYDSSCDGTWLLMKELYESRAWHSSNVNDYAASDIHAYLNNDFLALFDSGVQAEIKQVKIPYQNGTGGAGTLATGASGLETSVFLVSAYEVGFTTSDLFVAAEGVCLDYFSGKAASERIGYLNGAATAWWTRSPYSMSNTDPVGVATSGAGSITYATTSRGIRPALVLPADARVFDDGTIKP